MDHDGLLRQYMASDELVRRYANVRLVSPGTLIEYTKPPLNENGQIPDTWDKQPTGTVFRVDDYTWLEVLCTVHHFLGWTLQYLHETLFEDDHMLFEMDMSSPHMKVALVHDRKVAVARVWRPKNKITPRTD